MDDKLEVGLVGAMTFKLGRLCLGLVISRRPDRFLASVLSPLRVSSLATTVGDFILLIVAFELLCRRVDVVPVRLPRE